ncbi:hypothetical protein Q3G72_027073 [Acer saccharum]|nr:hypothetical protein Q3G72_027073 [Acer saccharum]
MSLLQDRDNRATTHAISTNLEGKRESPSGLFGDFSLIHEPDPPLVGKQTSQVDRTKESSSKTLSGNFPNMNNKVGTGMDHDPDRDLSEKSMVSPKKVIEISSVEKGTTIDVFASPIGSSQAQNLNPSKCVWYPSIWFSLVDPIEDLGLDSTSPSDENGGNSDDAEDVQEEEEEEMDEEEDKED